MKLNLVSLDFSDNSSQRINISIFSVEDENALKISAKFYLPRTGGYWPLYCNFQVGKNY